MSETITIRTNNVPRELLNPWQLSKKELKEFDYLIETTGEESDEQLEELWCNSCVEFFRYRGQLYDMSQFSRIIAPDAKRCHPMECSAEYFQGWDGYMSDSFFSGLLVKYARDEYDIRDGLIVVGMYCC